MEEERKRREAEERRLKEELARLQEELRKVEEERKRLEERKRSMFDPKDFDRTCKWAEDAGKAFLRRAQNNLQNAIRFHSDLDKFEKELKAHTGKAFVWKLPVEAIEQTIVTLQHNYPKGMDRFLILRNKEQMEKLGLRVGKEISTNAAEELQPGNLIAVAGEISSIDIENKQELNPQNTLPDQIVLVFVLQNIRFADPVEEAKRKQREEEERKRRLEEEARSKELAIKLAQFAKALAGDDREVRMKAVEEIGKLGEAAAPIARDFIKSMLRVFPVGKDSYFTALAKLSPKVHEQIKTLMTDDRAEQHWRALRELEELGKDADPAVPLLLALYDAERTGKRLKIPSSQPTNDEDSLRTHVMVMWALTKIAPNDPAVVHLILVAIEQPRGEPIHREAGKIRREAISLLNRMTIEPKRLIVALTSALHDSNPRTRETAHQLIEKLKEM